MADGVAEKVGLAGEAGSGAGGDGFAQRQDGGARRDDEYGVVSEGLIERAHLGGNLFVPFGLPGANLGQRGLVVLFGGEGLRVGAAIPREPGALDVNAELRVLPEAKPGEVIDAFVGDEEVG